MCNKLLLVCFVLLQTIPVNSVSAQELGDQPAPRSSVDEAVASEVAVLSAQLEARDRLRNDLINTVHWALSTAVGLLLVFAGFNWFTTTRVTKRERESLKATLREDIEEMLDQRTEQQYENLQQRLTADLDDLKEVIDHKYNYLRQGILIEMIHSTEETYKAELRAERYPEALNTLALVLRLCLDRGDESRIGSVIDRMRELLVHDFAIDADTCANVVRKVKDIPDKYALDRDAIEKRIVALRERTAMRG